MNFCASKAAMHPKPAEVIACLYTESATSPAAKTPGTEVPVTFPFKPVLMIM